MTLKFATRIDWRISSSRQTLGIIKPCECRKRHLPRFGIPFHERKCQPKSRARLWWNDAFLIDRQAKHRVITKAIRAKSAISSYIFLPSSCRGESNLEGREDTPLIDCFLNSYLSVIGSRQIWRSRNLEVMTCPHRRKNGWKEPDAKPHFFEIKIHSANPRLS